MSFVTPFCLKVHYEFASSSTLLGQEKNWCHFYVFFSFGVSCKWYHLIVALGYIAHVFYMTVRVYAFLFYLDLCEGIWVQQSTNRKCGISYITNIYTFSS